MIDRVSHNSPILDSRQVEVLDAIEPFTEGVELKVTRGHSLPIDQLRTIESYGRQADLLDKCPEFVRDDLTSKVELDGYGSVYRWQRVWSGLLNLYSTTAGKRGAKINPPFAAVCLFDYVVGGHNKKGELINPSPHIKTVPTAEQIEAGDYTPCPIDFSQKYFTLYPREKHVDIARVAEILGKAKTAGAGIRAITVELANGCVHIDIAKAVSRG